MPPASIGRDGDLLLPAATLPVIWRAPFADRVWRGARPEGLSIAEIVASIPGLPRSFMRRGVVMIGDDVVPRDMWMRVRPRSRHGAPVEVTLHHPLAGGGGGTGVKSVLALVATIALLVAAAWISGGALAPYLGSAFASGAFGAKLAAAAITVGGALVIRALTPPPSTPALEGNNTDSSSFLPAAVQGNTLKPGGAVPRVVGTRRVFPPFVTNPLVEVIGSKERIECVYALAGPHALSDLRLGETDIADIEEIEYLVHEGQATDAPQILSEVQDALPLITRQAATLELNLELSTFDVKKDTQTDLIDQATPANSIPTWHRIRTGRNPDEFWIVVSFPESIITENDNNVDRAAPVRLRIRAVGDVDWINLPEIHFGNRYMTPFKKTIRLKWQRDPYEGIYPAPGSYECPKFAFKHVPVATTGGSWDASSYFSLAAGNDVLMAGTETSTFLRNVALFDDRAEIYLDPDQFAGEAYEVEIIRGAVYKVGSFTPATYVFGSDGESNYSGVFDFFGYIFTGGTYKAPLNSGRSVHARMVVERVSTVVNEHPVQNTDCSIVMLRVTGRQLGPLSALASGKVKDWDGAAWSNWTTSSNPAPHLRDILNGSLNARPVPADLIDDAGLVEWRQHCISNDYTVDAVIEGKSARVAADLVAACGYARVRQAETFGVVVDRDRSMESPVQLFTPRNSRAFKFDKNFMAKPDAARVVFYDATQDYRETEIIVDNPSSSGGSRYEEFRYDGFVDEDKATARALHDFGQLDLRMTTYQFETDAQAIRCTRNDLIALQHDVLERQAGFGYVVDVIEEGGLVTGLRLEGAVPTGDVDQFFASGDDFISDIYSDGFFAEPRYGVAIRLKSSGQPILVAEISDPDLDETDTLTFTTPMAAPVDGLASGCLVATGPLGSEVRRVIVTSIVPKSGAAFPHQISAVDEAPALWA